MKILFIEDNPEFSKIVLDDLEDFGYTVKLIDNADDAVRELEVISQYDLVILDIMLMLGTIIDEHEAEDTGTAIYKRLRKINRDIRIVILTALSEHDIWKEFSGDPNVVYYGKPITTDIVDFLKEINGVR